MTVLISCAIRWTNTTIYRAISPMQAWSTQRQKPTCGTSGPWIATFSSSGCPTALASRSYPVENSSKSLRKAVAVVDEAACIGCTRCIDACPVDAIVGAQGYMHALVED